jgi:hypothetical protein
MLDRDSSLENLKLKRGIPSKNMSLAFFDYVLAFCTHRPSLLPIEFSGEEEGLLSRNSF